MKAPVVRPGEKQSRASESMEHPPYLAVRLLGGTPASCQIALNARALLAWLSGFRKNSGQLIGTVVVGGSC